MHQEGKEEEISFCEVYKKEMIKTSWTYARWITQVNEIRLYSVPSEFTIDMDYVEYSK